MSILAIGIVAMVMSLVAIRKVENWLLENEATESAVKWATYLRGNLSGLDGLLSGDPISKGDRRIFELASKAGNIFRYKVFGPDGIIVFASRANDHGKTNTNPYFSSLVKKGQTFAKIENEESFGKARTVVSEAYVPIMEHDRFKGAIEVYVDMTARAAALRRISNIFIVGLLLLLGGIGGVCGMFIRKNIRTRNLELRQVVDSRESILMAEQKLSAIFHTSPDFIAITGFKDGLFYDINDTWLAVTGYTRDEIVGHTTKELKIWVNPEHREQIVALMTKQGYVRNFETEFGGKDGRVLPVNISIAWIKIDGEQRLLTVATDITERKRAAAVLRKSEERFRTLFESAPISIREEDFSKVKARIDALGIAGRKKFIGYLDAHPEFIKKCAKLLEVTDVNQAGLELHKVASKAEYLKSLRKHTNRAYATIQMFLVAVHGGETNLSFETAVARADGSTRDVEARWSVVPGHEKTYARVLFSSIDITERKRAEAALREKDQRFAEVQAELFQVSRVSTVGQLSSALAHELNQPLAAIMNYVQLARDLAVAAKGQPSPKLTDFMDKAVDQAARAATVITRLRAFFEKGELARRKERLNEVLEEAVSLALLDRKDLDLKVRLELARSLPAVDIDKIQIQQVTLNLIRNAVEAMERSERRELLIRTRRANGTVRVEVRDTGPGLSEEVRSQMFESFVTTRSKGMGLGLSIAKSIIDAHGGRLSARSVKGKGTTFAFELPVSPPEGGRR